MIQSMIQSIWLWHNNTILIFQKRGIFPIIEHSCNDCDIIVNIQKHGIFPIIEHSCNPDAIDSHLWH